MDEKEKNAGGTLTTNLPDLACYMQSVIGQLEADKKRSAVHTYTYALKSVTEFYGGEGTPMPVGEVFTPGRLKEYEEWMKLEGARKRSSGKEGAQKIDRGPKGLSLNTISTYMRDLKAVYNRLADEKVLAYNSKLFDDVYTKVESQTKRALEAEQMNTLLHTDIEELPGGVRCALAYFLLMFLFRGMPFIDLAYLRKQDVKGRCIVYSRHKTGRQMAVRIPKEAAGLMEEFRNMNPGSVYLFPILNEEDGQEGRSKRDEQGRKDGQGRDNGKVKKDKELYLEYLRALRNFNLKLERIASLLLPGVKLSSYTPRHTWATLAFHSGVSIGIICKALGHSSIKVTETYLKPFENEKVDAANDELIISVAACNGGKKIA
ncbi:site-specific integrase [Bacteroides fragilis]|uniref:tyrosine-type recombinase/integrase n=1 Tax=Bacteroides TaxID=816 RepID=UPI002030CF21|nr:tyrosine-type recombinase/integrase [Bacteroides fragilis]MCE8585948.1 site-specific integrase [Bacteroides fragilis]MCE8590010.1 site-specific integrase [Bacteroides fragilis]MCE8656586.1 site-specific integrase [Bacteroides fragilis]MCE8661817.1 site-specific integrase [Bacteroides fragilis]MCM0261834.1 tyrosine-type recombinase/integrase [Bacteroides fragilis]